MQSWTSNRRVVLVGAVTLLVAVLVGLTLRSKWADGSSPGAVDLRGLPVEFHAGLGEYDLRPRRQGLDAVLGAIAERVEQAVPELSVTAEDAQGLSSAVRDRVGLLLAPDFDTWRRMAGANAPAASDPGGEQFAAYRRMWDASASLLKDSPLSGSGLVIRRIPCDQQPEIGHPGTLFLRTGGSGGAAARYPEPPADDPGVVCIELLMPVEYKLPGGSEPLRATASMRFYRGSGVQAWSPADMYLYFDSQAFGKDLLMPLY